MITQYDLGSIFRESGPGYRVQHKLSCQQAKVMRMISQCRTSAMGSHVSKCNECGHVAITHNSCRNRHCPKCQGLDAVQWVDKLQYDLLPIRYFHLVFTIPDLLNRMVLINQRVMYDLLFKASSDTIKQLAADKKRLGIETGILAVLHTWGQNLMDHPHIHMLVPAGGVDIDTGQWVNSSKKFFLPVKVISAVFKGKFLGGLKQLYQNKQLKLLGSIKDLQSKSVFKALLDQLYAKDWVVYTKKTFKSNVQVLRYLGRYTHRIAISNKRIKAYDGQTVTFAWKDYKDHCRQKQMVLEVHEFIRRFLLHVLPYSYHKIRYYGLFSLRNRQLRINIIRKKMSLPVNEKPYQKLSIGERVFNISGIDISLCPCCKTGKMMPVTNVLELRLSG
ncbi:MAG: IS91 family transposase [Bacteroidota bacterium]